MRRPLAPLGSLSVVIPAYNAASYIPRTLDEIQSYLERGDLPHEIIVVNDGSRDGTSDVVLRRARGVRLLVNDRNRGKGHAVRRGVLAARMDRVLFTDADHATAIEHLERFVPQAAAADIVIGSRRLPESRILRRQPRFRQALGRIFPYVVRALVLPQIADTQCGFKLFRREVAADLFNRATIDRFCFDVEILALALRRGYRVREVAVQWQNPEGGSTLRIHQDTIQMMFDLLRIAWRHRRGVREASASGAPARR